MSTSSLIPPGYTFLNQNAFLSAKALDLVLDLLEKADNRNPDFFEMHVYNDFHAFGVLDLYDKALSTLHSKVHKKDWKEAMVQAEAVTHFINIENTFLMCNDGRRVIITNKAYGALIVAIIRALNKEGILDAEHFPSLETFLRTVSQWCEDIKGQGLKTEYGRVCKAIGKRLFQHKSENIKALEKARVEEWKESRAKIRNSQGEDKDDDDDGNDDDDEDDEEEDEDSGRPWFGGAKSQHEDYEHPDFALARVWKEYKDYLRKVPTSPLRGPPKWDIKTWSAAEKQPFLFSNMDYLF